MGHEAADTLVPSKECARPPALGLNDETTGKSLRPQRLLRIVPGAGAAMARVTNELGTHVRGRGLEGPSALSPWAASV